MEDNVRSEFRQKIPNTLAISHISNAKGKLPTVLMPIKVQSEEEQPRFALIQTDELSWTVIDYLTAEFRSDRASCTRHKYGFPCNLLANRFQINLNRLSSK